MAVNSIHNYAASYGYTSTGNQNLITTEDDAAAVTGSAKSQIQGKNAGQLDMSDFLNLLVAQMVNQDIMNPVSDTDFIAQMAQFSSLQGINTLQEYTLSNYAVSYVGKNVLIVTANEKTGALEEITGMVERVTFSTGTPKVVVDGKEYDLYTVMEISSNPIEIKTPATGDNGDDDGDENGSGDDSSGE